MTDTELTTTEKDWLPAETLKPRDPADISYPPTLPLEIALRHMTPKECCEVYGISEDEWASLRSDPVFVADLKAHMAELKTSGLTFRTKAAMQAAQMLKTSWQMVQDPKTPAAVRADLIKTTIRVAGLDGSKDQGDNTSQKNALQININLG